MGKVSCAKPAQTLNAADAMGVPKSRLKFVGADPSSTEVGDEGDDKVIGNVQKASGALETCQGSLAILTAS